MHLATFAGYLEMTETILLQRDRLLRAHQEVFDVDEADNLTLTPLMKAAINGHLEVSNLDFSIFLDSKTGPEIRGKPSDQEWTGGVSPSAGMYAGAGTSGGAPDLR